MYPLQGDVARIRRGRRFGFANSGWTLDAYPHLDTLDAGHAMTVAALEGPGVVTRFHSTQHWLYTGSQELQAMTVDERKALAARGIVLEVYYDGREAPGVRVPLGDFFLDGCGGRARHFTTPFVEKAPESYNCFIPMPFKQSCRLVLRNDTPYNFMNYSYVEWDALPSWEDELGYFHATWHREAFQLTSSTDRQFFHVDGRGHLLGRSLSIVSDEPLFKGQTFIMEGNNEIRIDGSTDPVVDYLGTEDAFGMSWGWPTTFSGMYNGCTVLQHDIPAMVTTYRFRANNTIPFEKSLDLRIDWTHEFPGNANFHDALADRVEKGGAWVDYASGFCWYQESVGYPHAEMLALDKRVKAVLHPNP